MTNINRIEIDYHEDRPYNDEADKRSQQFRVLAHAYNDLAEAFEEQGKRIEELEGKIKDLEKPPIWHLQYE